MPAGNIALTTGRFRRGTHRRTAAEPLQPDRGRYSHSPPRGGSNPPHLADSGDDVCDGKQLLKKTLNMDGENLLLAAIAEASG